MPQTLPRKALQAVAAGESGAAVASMHVAVAGPSGNVLLLLPGGCLLVTPDQLVTTKTGHLQESIGIGAAGSIEHLWTFLLQLARMVNEEMILERMLRSSAVDATSRLGQASVNMQSRQAMRYRHAA